MKKIYITFSGRTYDATTKLVVERATQMGADELIVFDDKWLLGTGFVAANRWLYEAPPNHGFGYCSWKAFIVLTAMDRVHNGDVVLYVDADTYPIAPLGGLFDACARAGGIFLFEEQGCSNLRFTKADCMVAMGLSVGDATIAAGRFSLWQKGPFLPRQVLSEWWAYSVNPRCQLWDQGGVLVPNQSGFGRHTTEQSVLTNLARKYQIPLHRTPDQNGSIGLYPEDDLIYPQTFIQNGVVQGSASDVRGSSYRNA